MYTGAKKAVVRWNSYYYKKRSAMRKGMIKDKESKLCCENDHIMDRWN